MPSVLGLENGSSRQESRSDDAGDGKAPSAMSERRRVRCRAGASMSDEDADVEGPWWRIREAGKWGLIGGMELS